MQQPRLRLVQPPHSHKPDACPICGNASLSKRWIQQVAGLIDFAEVERDLAARGIELRGGAADEAPLAYKRLTDVLAHHAETIAVLHTLRPIGVGHGRRAYLRPLQGLNRPHAPGAGRP